MSKSRVSSVDTATEYGLGGPGSIPGIVRFFSSPQRPDQLSAITSLLSSWGLAPFPAGKAASNAEVMIGVAYVLMEYCLIN